MTFESIPNTAHNTTQHNATLLSPRHEASRDHPEVRAELNRGEINWLFLVGFKLGFKLMYNAEASAPVHPPPERSSRVLAPAPPSVSCL